MGSIWGTFGCLGVLSGGAGTPFSRNRAPNGSLVRFGAFLGGILDAILGPKVSQSIESVFQKPCQTSILVFDQSVQASHVQYLFG